MTRLDLQACHYERLSNIRRWQIHTGSNHFCFNGKCVTGRNLFGAIMFICLTSLITLLWLVFELPFLMKEFNNNNLIILIVGRVLIFYTYGKTNNTEILNSLVYFFRSMCTDPGIIQRPSSIERLILKNELNLNQLTCDVEVNDMIVKCKYCVACHIIRPPRSAHYSICSNCIYIFDHHCPFLSTCIAMRNYRFFILFLLFFLLQTELFLFITSLIKVKYFAIQVRQISFYIRF
jgi:palmitoyltransferase ZDHHC9/14/18